MIKLCNSQNCKYPIFERHTGQPVDNIMNERGKHLYTLLRLGQYLMRSTPRFARVSTPPGPISTLIVGDTTICEGEDAGTPGVWT